MPFTCGRHRAFVYERGGIKPVGELTPLTLARWGRIRDEISGAQVDVGTSECCDLLADIRTVKHELHIHRDGKVVWQGVIARLEYEWDVVRVFAEDILWVAKRTVLKTGYSHAFPNTGHVLDRMDWLLRSQTYAPNGDPWRMVPHLHPIRNPDLSTEPDTSRVTPAYSTYVWDDFDSYAEDAGTDYTVVNRDIYYWDVNLRWKIIPSLDESHLSQFPRIVEYGNQAATHGYVSNVEGYAGIADAPPDAIAEWGHVDLLITNLDDQDEEGHVPTEKELAQWSATAGRNINGRYPPPLSIVVPANTTLMPGAPWEIEDMVPGAWFQVHVDRLCRMVNEWQRIQDVTVEESAPNGETVNFSAVSAPGSIVEPEI